MAFILSLGLARDQYTPVAHRYQCLSARGPRRVTLDFMRLVLGWALLLATTTLCAAPLEPGIVRVLHVHDGDTLTVRTPQGQTLKVRIAAIDAPELRQAHGEFAREHLRTLLQDLQPTLDRIARGDRNSHRNDGTVFQNRERKLPAKPSGYYKEYVHPTPKLSGPGPQRVIFGTDGDAWYTPDHYKTFIKIREKSLP